MQNLIDRYLNDHSKPNKGKKSYQDDIYFSKKLKTHFKEMNITDVSPKHISSFIKKRREDEVGDVTINHELRLLKHAYNLAVRKWELINESPFSKIKIPRGDVKRVRCLSADEEKHLFKVLPKWLKPIVVIARETGLRLSNIANLSWSQVNLFRKTSTIETVD